MSPHAALVFIALAIQLRDNAHKLTDEQLRKLINEIAEFGVLSNRQLAKLCNKRISHVTIGRIISKHTKVGGSVNPADLERIRGIIFSRSIGQTDYKMVLSVVDNGTSQGMLSRITGISQSTISRKKIDGLVL